jgi:hypothetical protein
MPTTTSHPVKAAPQRTRRVGLAVLLAMAACSAYWWAQSSREVRPGAYSPPAPPAAEPLERRQSAPSPFAASPLDKPERVAHETKSAAPPSATGHPEDLPTMEQEIDPEQLEADERARMQAVQFELGSVLNREAVDRDFRDRAQADIDAAISNLGSTGVRLVSTDCRTTLCRLEVWSRDIEAMGEFLDNFPATLGWSTDMRMDTQQSAGGGVVTTLFMTGNGVAMPTLAAEQQ